MILAIDVNLQAAFRQVDEFSTAVLVQLVCSPSRG